MPDDLLGAVGSGHPKYLSNVLQNHQTIRHILPEEPCVLVKHHAVWLGWILGNHGELDSTVANIRIEDSLERGFIADLAIVHGTDALGYGQDLWKLQGGECL